MNNEPMAPESKRSGRVIPGVRTTVTIGALVVAGTLVACRDEYPTAPKLPGAVVRAQQAALAGDGAVVLIGAGNMTRCDRQFDEATARLLDGVAGTVITLGDNVYGGTASDFTNCYGPSWGRHLDRTRPSAGESDYTAAGSDGYHSYFGAAAGAPGDGYYSYDVGTNWHIVVLNSSIATSAGSAQEQWLRADLAATTRPCVLAYWHFPRFSSFSTQVRSSILPLWDALYAAQADVVVNGHYRLYERFGPQKPDGTADPDRGIRQITVGTGGQGLDGLAGITPRANSEALITGLYGVLKLSLDEYSYAWQFVPADGQTPVDGQASADAGEAVCHGRPGQPPVPNLAPRGDAGGPYVTEGTVALDGSASRDIDRHLPLTYAWSFSDGTTATGRQPTKAFAADGEYTATLVVTDALGLAGDPVSTTITVRNLPPQVSAGPDASFDAANSFTLQGTFTDPGGSGDGPWSWTIAWGDGQTTSGTTSVLGAPISPTHRYGSFGEYTVRLTISDRDGAIGSDETSLSVRDANAIAVLVGAGDIAECGDPGSELTARLLDNIPGTVVALGDNAYLSGSIEEYTDCYHPSWGRHKARTKPAPGNHEYATPGAAGYYEYYGAVAGDPTKGYYSYTAGEWLVVVLNSASGSANRSATSPQGVWLKSLLASTTRECVVAYMHHPQFTSADGRSTGEWNVIDLWNILYEGGVELVLAGHDHLYDRFAPMKPDGTLDLQYGIRQITNGAGGGEGLYRLGTRHPNSERFINTSFGVVKVTLRGNGYDWEFVPVSGTQTDVGSGTCHGRPDGGLPTNQAPTARPGGPYSAEHTVAFDGSGSTDPDGHLPLSYYWSFGDGTAGSGAKPVKTYAASGTYTVTLTVTDAMGRASAPVNATVTIANVPPAADAGPDAHAVVNTVFDLAASFTDGGGANDSPWSWTIAWGDGASSSGTTTVLGGPIEASHTFTAIGEYTLRLTVTDREGGAHTDEKLVRVTAANQPPVAHAGGPYRSESLVGFTAAASSDPDAHLPLTYLWDFGDGTASNAMNPTKAYAADGEYQVTLLVTDALGQISAPATTVATIANLEPAVNPVRDTTLEQGQTYALSTGFVDAGGSGDGPWSWTIAWGDGSTSTGTTSTYGGPVSASHAYASAGTYTARVTVTDKDGGAGTDEFVVRVSVATGPSAQTVLYALSRSGSAGVTAGACGTRLQCFKTAIIETNANTVSIVENAALAQLDGTNTQDVNLKLGGKQLLIAPDADPNLNGKPDLADAVNRISLGGSTCFTCGLLAAKESFALARSTSPKVIVMLSERPNTVLPADGTQLSQLQFPSNVVIRAFAVGPAVTCGSDPNGLGSLGDAAALTPGGSCTNVASFDGLGALLTSAVGGTAPPPPSDVTAPVVTLTAPANGATTGSTPAFSGTGGTASGDEPTVTVKVWSGAVASGTPVRTMVTTITAGYYNAAPSQGLGTGSYVAQTEQRDATGNVGRSAVVSFTVSATPPPPGTTGQTVAWGLSRSGTASAIGGTCGSRLQCFKTAINEAVASTLDMVENAALMMINVAEPDQDVNLGSSGKQLLIAPAADPNGNGKADHAEAVDRISLGGGTCFTCALQAAERSFQTARPGSRRVIILVSERPATYASTGFTSSGSPTGYPAMSLWDMTFSDPNTVVHAFAVGPDVRCDSDPNGHGSLNVAAALTPGGSCTNVDSFDGLGAIIAGAVGR